MALGLLSVLGFVAKIYMILSKSNSLVDETEYNELKTFKSKLTKIPGINKKLVDKLIIPKVGSVIEEDAFANLINKVQSKKIAYLGLDDISARKVWKIYRNKLAHLAVPLSPVGVYDKDMSHLSWVEVEHEVSKLGSFFVRDDLILCNSDKLVYDSKKIGIWLCSHIDTCNENTVTNALNWLKSELA